jgi:hypothetical protein
LLSSLTGTDTNRARRSRIARTSFACRTRRTRLIGSLFCGDPIGGAPTIATNATTTHPVLTNRRSRWAIRIEIT